MKRLLIWGAGDQGTVTLDCALSMKAYDKIDFLDFKEKGHREIPGYEIYHEIEEDPGRILRMYDEVIVASGDNKLRERKASILASMEITLATIVHPTAVVSRFAQVGAGTTVLAGAVIHTNAVVGRGCIINTGAIVEHDCRVEDFVNISPNVSMAGHTIIGGGSFLGIGSTVIDGILIGRETIVGAGAVVIRNIPDYAVVSGVPAEIKRWTANTDN